MAAKSVAHQDIVMNLCVALRRVLTGRRLMTIQEMRIRFGTRVRYPDVVVCAGPIEQRTKTLTDAIAIFEVLSDETATTDREIKLAEYATIPSSRCYVLLEQTAIDATVYRREPGGAWVSTTQTEGLPTPPGLDIAVPLADVYLGLTFET
jgi:Uma2 family endonuclease